MSNEKFDLDQLRLVLRVANECLQDLNARVTKLEDQFKTSDPRSAEYAVRRDLASLEARVAQFVEWVRGAGQPEPGSLYADVSTRDVLDKLRELGLVKENPGGCKPAPRRTDQ